MRLSNFILKNLEPILQEWEDFAATLVPVDQEMDRTMLRDHVKIMLNTIAADLARPETAHAQSEKSKGHRPVKKTAAATHGVDRLAAGFSLVAAMAEYRALRASVIRLWQDAQVDKPITKAMNDDITRFNEAIDQAVSESVASYSLEKERQARVFEAILSSMSDLSFTFDLDGRFTYANKAMTELVELPLKDIVGKNFADFGLPAATELQEKIRHVINTTEQFRGEMAAPIGQEGRYDVNFVPVLDKKGVVEAVVGNARKIADRTAAGME